MLAGVLAMARAVNRIWDSVFTSIAFEALVAKRPDIENIVHRLL